MTCGALNKMMGIASLYPSYVGDAGQRFMFRWGIPASMNTSPKAVKPNPS